MLLRNIINALVTIINMWLFTLICEKVKHQLTAQTEEVKPNIAACIPSAT